MEVVESLGQKLVKTVVECKNYDAGSKRQE